MLLNDFPGEHHTWVTERCKKLCSLVRKKISVASLVSFRFRDVASVNVCEAFFFIGTMDRLVVQKRQTSAAYVGMLQQAYLLTEGPHLYGDD